MESCQPCEQGPLEKDMTKGAVCRLHEFCQSAAVEPPRYSQLPHPSARSE